MNITEFFSREFTFTINGLALAGLAVFFIIAFIAIMVFINRILAKLRSYERPKYGFLGKSLYSLLTLAVMIAGLGFFGITFTQQQDFTIKASKNVNVSLAVTPKIDVVDFKAVPIVEGEEWGKDSRNMFDFIWNIEGPQNLDRFEFGKTQSDPGGFSVKLLPGQYKAKLLIVFEGKSYSFEKNFSV